MASTLFRSLSTRVLERKRSRRTAPPTEITAVTPTVVVEPVQEEMETLPAQAVVAPPPQEEVEPVMYPDGLPAAPAETTVRPSTGSSSKPRRRPSIFNRLHSRNVSAESTATTSSTRSTASSLATSISSTATTLSRSVSTRARAAKRRSADLMATPMYQGVIVEDDAISLKDQDGAGCSFDIIL